MTTINPLWVVGLIQFLICGAFVGMSVLAFKHHKVPESEKTQVNAIIGVIALFALFGLIIMAGSV